MSSVFMPGANAALSVAQVEAEKARIADADALLMQLESPLESVLARPKSPISIKQAWC
ncbi:Ribokinase [Raoultella terrigena]|uniref:Ribokinase n=1 Tax=Raoultella terrigena TaxID=577 RepID=A0A4U9D9I5_RAOTE|nr:Ribokinase [Raoultella terrigena]